MVTRHVFNSRDQEPRPIHVLISLLSFLRYAEGKLPAKELSALMIACGGPSAELTGEDLEEAVTGLNTQHDGMVHKDDFLEYWKTNELPDETAEEPEDYEICEDDEGVKFYYHIQTGTSKYRTPRFKKGALALHLGQQHGHMELADPKEEVGGDEEEVEGTENPAEWEECDDGEGHIYYYNKKTGDSMWEKPKFRLSAGGGGDGGGGGDESEDRANWEECDDGEGNLFWLNNVTGTSQWDVPTFKAGALLLIDGEEGTEDPADWEEADDGEGNSFYSNKKTGESRWEKPKFRARVAPGAAGVGDDGTENPADWEQQDDGEGNLFWHNKLTSDSMWDTPNFQRALLPYDDGRVIGGGTEDPADWEECDDGEGNIFYSNKKTGESTWEKPHFK
jgi:hypothetical protein